MGNASPYSPQNINVYYIKYCNDCAGELKYDIALVKLEEEVPTQDTHIPEIQAVPLPPSGEARWPCDGTDCYLAGWGCTQSGQY